MDPAEIKQEIDKIRVAAHATNDAAHLIGLRVQLVETAIPRMDAKLDTILREQLTHGKDTVVLQSSIERIASEMQGATTLTRTMMKAADDKTDAKIDGHLDAHKKWFPLLLMICGPLIVAAIIAVAVLIKKGGQ